MKPATRSRAFLCLSPLLLSLGLGFGLNLAVTPAAQACQGTGSIRPTKQNAFEFDNGLKLGLPETAIVKTLGEPQQRTMVDAGLRCGSVREAFAYNDNAIAVMVDRPAPGSMRHQRKEPRRYAQSDSSRTIVRIHTTSPNLTLSGQVRVGDSLEQLLNTYGQPQQHSREGSKYHLHYSQGNQRLNFILNPQAKITEIELIQGEPDITDILAKGR